MLGDFLINGESAFQTYGVRPHESFFDELQAPRAKKEFVTNKSRMEHGIRVTLYNGKFESRDVTLNVTISGHTQEEFRENKRAFFELLESDNLIEIQLAGVDNESVYKLYYKSGANYKSDPDGTFCSVALKMCEPNPGDRE